MATPLILVVDDDRDTRELYRLVFDLGGYRVIEAASVADAAHLAGAERPNLIIVDWMLVDGNGFDLCERLHRRGRTRRIPLIAVTGAMLSPTQIARACELGCQRVMAKPVNLDHLLRLVFTTLEIGQGRALRAAAIRIRRYADRLRRGIPVAQPTVADLRRTASMLLDSPGARAAENVALVLADDRGRYVAANTEAGTLTGYDPKELVRLSVADLTAAPHGLERQKLWENFLTDGRQEGVYVLKRRDGGSVETHYVAMANVTPGLHLSALARTGPAHPLLD